jgi:CBS domain containing-hemolysin-like protein
LSSCQLGITLTTLLTGFVVEPSVGKLLEGPLSALGVPGVHAVSLTVAMILATLGSMLLGELVPKNLAIARALAVGRAVARPQLVFTAVFKPFILLLNGFANSVLRAMGIEAQEEISGARSPAELASLVRRSAELGTLDEGTARFVSRTLSFAERTAADVMTPRMRVATVDATDPVEDVIRAARSTGHSRFPVIGDSPDDIRGLVHVKKAVAVPAKKRSVIEAGAIMTEVLRVPETIHLDALISQLRDGNLQLAVVLDEYGGTAGVVTLEDLVEEIVGEVSDEHDRLAPGVLQSASGDWFFPGLMRPDEVSEQVPGIVIEDDPAYETIGGFVMRALGRVPVQGDRVEVEGGSLEVTRMDGRRVDRLRFSPGRPASVGAPEGRSA